MPELDHGVMGEPREAKLGELLALCHLKMAGENGALCAHAKYHGTACT